MIFWPLLLTVLEPGEQPWTAWTSTNRLAICGGGSLEILDPASGLRKTILKAADGDLNPPDAYDPAFMHLAFRKGKSLSVFDVAAQKTMSVDAGDLHGLAFSPDGTKLAYAKDRDLYVWFAKTGQSKRITTADRPRLLNGVLTWVYWEEITDHAEVAFHWSPDSKSLAYLQTDESPVKESSFVDFDGPPPTVHLQTYPFAGGPNPKVQVGVISASGGPTTWLKPGPYEYVTRFGWTPAGAPWLLTLNRGQTQSELWQASVVTGAAKRLLADTNPQWVNSTEDIGFLPDGNILLNSQRDGFDRLYRWNGQGGIVNPVTPPKQSLNKPEFATHGIRWIDPKGEWLMFASGDPQRFEQQLYRVRLDGGSCASITSLPGTHDTSVSPNGQFYVDVYSRLDQPPATTLKRMDGRTVAVLGTPEALPPDYQKAKIVRIPAFDGFRLPATIRMPAGFDPEKKYPVIVNVYGGPGIPSVVDAWRGTGDQQFTAAGFVYVTIDPRSATQFDERLPRSVKGQAVGTREINDLVDAVRWLKKQSYVDPARVGLWGWSGGGNFTLLALTRSKEFAAGVAVAPVSDWRFYDTVYTEQLMGLPAENAKGYNLTARWRNAKDLHGRLLIMYGTHDDNVHPINEEKFLDALIRAGKSAEVMVFPGRKHGLEDEAAQGVVFRKIVEFFGRM